MAPERLPTNTFGCPDVNFMWRHVIVHIRIQTVNKTKPANSKIVRDVPSGSTAKPYLPAPTAEEFGHVTADLFAKALPRPTRQAVFNTYKNVQQRGCRNVRGEVFVVEFFTAFPFVKLFRWPAHLFNC